MTRSLAHSFTHSHTYTHSHTHKYKHVHTHAHTSQVIDYLCDIFSHEDDRYASAERLERELFLLAKQRLSAGDASSLVGA